MLRIASFNVNNLFSRWSFQSELPEHARVAAARLATGLPVLRAESRSPGPPTGTLASLPDGRVVEVSVDGTVLTGVLRTFGGRLVRGKKPADTAWIAARIATLGADVLCLQEIEDQATLDAFHRDYLAPLGAGYPYRMVVEGNDPRRIDVAVLSRRPLRRVSSWRFWPDPDRAEEPIFSRDLLQIEVAAAGRPLHVMINHLKSNYIADEFRLDPAERVEARAKVAARRTRQCQAIATIVHRQRLHRRLVVLGDMNDQPDSETLAPLGQAGLVEQIGVAGTLPGPTRRGTLTADRFPDLATHPWTHRYRGTAGTEFTLYDQVWVSPDLAGRVSGSWIMRRTQITGDATDHDPVAVDLDL